MDPVSAVPLRVLQSATMTIDGGWNARDVCSSYWRCYWNDAPGAAVELADGRCHAITPDAVHLVPAWVRFSCRCSASVGHWYAHVDLVGWPSSLVAPAFPAPVALAEQTLVALARETAALDAGTLARGAAAAGLFAATLARALARLPAPRRRALEAPARAGPLTAVLDHVQRHLGEPLDNPRLAVVAGCTSDHLIRLFRQHLGQTPAQYVQERRIATAAERLLHGAESIEQVAAACGFANRYHFSRVFARLLGCPPARYRRTDRV